MTSQGEFLIGLSLRVTPRTYLVLCVGVNRTSKSPRGVCLTMDGGFGPSSAITEDLNIKDVAVPTNPESGTQWKRTGWLVPKNKR